MPIPMRLVTLAALGLLLAGCGGGEATAPSAPVPLPAGTSLDFASAFITLERGQSSPSGLPSWATAPGGEAKLLVGPSLPACITSASQSNGDGTTTVTWTYACTGPDGGLLSGSVAFTFATAGSGTYTVQYQALKYVQGTRSWTWNGTKRVVLDAAAQQAAITTPVPLTLTVADTAGAGSTRTYSYGCTLTSDWATAGTLRLWGAFTFQASGDTALEGRIAPTSSVTWAAASGCCHPVSGTIALSQGLARADVAFGMPCGSVQLLTPGGTALARQLPACPS